MFVTHWWFAEGESAGQNQIPGDRVVGNDFRLNIQLWKLSLWLLQSASNSLKAEIIFPVLFGSVWYLFMLFLYVKQLSEIATQATFLFLCLVVL